MGLSPAGMAELLDSIQKGNAPAGISFMLDCRQMEWENGERGGRYTLHSIVTLEGLKQSVTWKLYPSTMGEVLLEACRTGEIHEARWECTTERMPPSKRYPDSKKTRIMVIAKVPLLRDAPASSPPTAAGPISPPGQGVGVSPSAPTPSPGNAQGEAAEGLCACGREAVAMQFQMGPNKGQVWCTKCGRRVA